MGVSAASARKRFFILCVSFFVRAEDCVSSDAYSEHTRFFFLVRFSLFSRSEGTATIKIELTEVGCAY